MRLPKWLWRMIRSKRVHRFLAIAPFVAVVGVVVFYWGVNRWGQAKIDTALAQMREMDIPLQPKLPLPEEPLPDARKSFYADLVASVGSPLLFRDAGIERDAWPNWLTGTAQHPPGDLRILIANPKPDHTQELLAKDILSSLKKNRQKVPEIIALVGTPTPEFSESDAEARYAADAASRTGWFLLFHGLFLAEAEDLDSAIRDIQLAFQLAQAWQYPTPYWWWVSDRVLDQANDTLPLLIGNFRNHPAHLHRLEASLASVDSVVPYLQAKEGRLHRLCTIYAEDEHITNQPIFIGLSDLTWGDGWGKRRATLADWWWEAKPIGYRKASLAKDVESLIPFLQGLPEAGDPHHFTFADLKSYQFQSDPRTHAFSDVWSDSWDNWTYIQDGLGLNMSTLLNLRFQRLSIAAELHRHRTGSYPETTKQLMSEPLISPFDGEPIRLAPLPDRRLRFEAAGATLLPDGTLHFDPTTPITFDYPPKP